MPKTPAPAAEAAPSDPAAGAGQEPKARPPLVLKPGIRIQLGWRKGKVDTVRGGWKKPYDVRVVWDGEKYPQWLMFSTLELDYERGALQILDGSAPASKSGS